MAHPTRTGDLVVVLATRRTSSTRRRRARSSRPSHFFGQHGYVPDVQDLAANVNMRATFIAGGDGHRQGQVDGARTIDLAPTLAYMLGVPEPQHSQGRVLLEIVKGGDAVTPLSIIGLNDFHGQLDPTTLRHSTASTPASAARRSSATMFDEEVAQPARARRCCWPAATTSAPRRRTRPCSRTCRRSTSRTPGAWTPRPTATTSSTTASSGCSSIRRGPNFPFLADNIVETATGKAPPWVTPSVVFTVNGVKVGVIGAELENTPELVSAGATAGLTFLPEAPRIKAESERLRRPASRCRSW